MVNSVCPIILDVCSRLYDKLCWLVCQLDLHFTPIFVGRFAVLLVRAK